MAEIEGIEELIEEVDGEIAGEAEGVEGEEAAEIEEEITEAREATSNLGNVVNSLKKLNDLARPFVKFVAENAAVAAIFYGVNVGLKKLTAKKPGDASAQKQYQKIHAMGQFLTGSADLSKKVSDWLHAHKDEMIDLEGIQVPLIAIFTKYTNPLEDVRKCMIHVHFQYSNNVGSWHFLMQILPTVATL